MLQAFRIFESGKVSTFGALTCKHLKTCVSKDIEYDIKKHALGV